MADQRSSRVHPQQGRMPPNNLKLGQWYDLDVNQEYPEGNVRIYCTECGDKNRRDEGWRYCRDLQHAATMSALAGPMMSLLGGRGSLAGLATIALLRYECKECREDKPLDGDEDEEEEEEEKEEEKEVGRVQPVEAAETPVKAEKEDKEEMKGVAAAKASGAETTRAGSRKRRGAETSNRREKPAKKQATVKQDKTSRRTLRSNAGKQGRTG